MSTTKEELIARYQDAPDEQLLHILNNGADYTPLALEAVQHLIDLRGGQPKMQANKQLEHTKAMERERIVQHYKAMLARKTPFHEIHPPISDLLTAEETKSVADKLYEDWEEEKEERSVAGPALTRLILGIFVAAAIGSVVNVFLAQAKAKIPLLFFLVPYFLACIIISSVSKKKLKNPLVWGFAFVAMGISAIGTMLLITYFRL